MKDTIAYVVYILKEECAGVWWMPELGSSRVAFIFLIWKRDADYISFSLWVCYFNILHSEGHIKGMFLSLCD